MFGDFANYFQIECVYLDIVIYLFATIIYFDYNRHGKNHCCHRSKSGEASRKITLFIDKNILLIV